MSYGVKKDGQNEKVGEEKIETIFFIDTVVIKLRSIATRRPNSSLLFAFQSRSSAPNNFLYSAKTPFRQQVMIRRIRDARSYVKLTANTPITR